MLLKYTILNNTQHQPHQEVPMSNIRLRSPQIVLLPNTQTMVISSTMTIVTQRTSLIHSYRASADSESQAVATEPKRFKDRHICGFPILCFLFLITLLVVGAIVGGILGGVLGTNKDTVADTDANRQPNEEETVTTTTSRTSTSSSSTSSISPPPTPSPKTPPGVLEPRYDAWYYIKNKVINPSHELAWTTNLQNGTQYNEMTIPSGDLWEDWGFWPTEVNSTMAAHYREEMNITAIYMLYSRGMVQLNYSTSPTEEGLDEQDGWWWVERNPYGGVYINGAFYGPDRVFTVLDRGVGWEEDVVRYTMSWNTTEDESLRMDRFGILIWLMKGCLGRRRSGMRRLRRMLLSGCAWWTASFVRGINKDDGTSERKRVFSRRSYDILRLLFATLLYEPQSSRLPSVCHPTHPQSGNAKT